MKTRTDRLFEVGPGKLTVHDISDMCWRQRRDGWVDVRVNVTLDVEVLPDHGPEAALELGRIGEDEYWDIVDPR